MSDPGQHSSASRRIAYRLFAVLVAGAVAVFGLLWQQMGIHSGGFDSYAFEYWGPRALNVVLATTLAGIVVVNFSWTIRAAFGAIVGLCFSFLYIWAR
jgi:hypothetical protein